MEFDLDMADLRPSLWNLLIILLAVIIMVPTAKYIFTEVMFIPGFSPLVQSI